VTIRPRFSGTVPAFNNVSLKKSQFIPDAHLSCFWLGVLDLSQFAHLCSHMLTHWWPKNSSDLIWIYDKITGGLWGAHDSISLVSACLWDKVAVCEMQSCMLQICRVIKLRNKIAP